MTQPPAIEVRDLCKKFARNQDRHRSYALRDVFRELTGRRPDPTHLRPDEFLAVNRLSFDVAPGEAVALIGENGCGKTTTLRMIAGIIKPDAGTVTVRGRVQALIALGAGFNPRLSGRDNIRNNAAIMGFSSRQTNRIMQEVIDFADIGEFIDSPVSTYSSGMKARLGFSVAVHLEPDILIVDEVLGVGDFAFQNKCFERMLKLREQNTSFLIVSHSHNRLMQMCDTALWLQRGKPQQQGPVRDVVQVYLDFLRTKHPEKPLETKTDNRSGQGLYGPEDDGEGKVEAVQLVLEQAQSHGGVLPLHGPVTILYSFRLKTTVRRLNVTVNIFTEDGRLMTAISTLNGDLLAGEHTGFVQCQVTCPHLPLAPGRYVMGLAIHEGHHYLYRQVATRFTVSAADRLTWGVMDLNPRIEVLALS